MPNESKGVYVQMPKPENDEAVKLLAELVKTVRYMAPRSNGVNKAYYAAKEYLERNGVVIEKERGVSTNERVKCTLP